MSNFLDKVGLQHVVEKIKGLLSGYLPLSGGTMTGDIKFGNILIASSLFLSKAGVQANKIVNKKLRTASFDADSCKTLKFILSKDESATGLIANNSTTVVSEVDDLQAVRLFYSREISSNDSKYIGVNALGVIYSIIDLNTSQISITVTQDVEAESFFQSISNASQVKIKIAKNTTCHLCKDIWIIDNPEYVESIVVKGGMFLNFSECKNLKTFRGNDSYLLNSEDFANFFKDFTKLTDVYVNDWNIDTATTLSSMFYNCSALSNITLNNWDTRNVTDTSNMFAQCYSLEKLDITGWNMTNVTNMTDMFAGCSKINLLKLSEGFGRMKDEAGTLDLSSLTLWTTESVQTLLTLYDRKANGLGVITIKLSSATKNALGASGIQTLTAKGYTIA